MKPRLLWIAYASFSAFLVTGLVLLGWVALGCFLAQVVKDKRTCHDTVLSPVYVEQSIRPHGNVDVIYGGRELPR